MLTLARYSIGIGDRFAHQAKAQLRACLQAAERGVEVVPVWNKSNREHTIIGSDGWLKADLEALLNLVAQRTLLPVVDRILPLEQAAEGERLLEDREVFGKVLLEP